MATPEGAQLASAWNGFLEILDPFRADLFRYCRRLTGNVWDAEDLVQATLEQGFARFARARGAIEHPRAYLLRIASNLWMSQVRRELVHARSVGEAGPAPADGGAEQGAWVEDAAERLLGELAPQEQAAVVLKEVFELSLAEIADTLSTTTGAVKAALHRGRTRLRAAEETGSVRRSVSQAAVERFVELFNARDREGLLALLLESAIVDMNSVETFVGREAIGRQPGWLYYNMLGDGRWEVATFSGEPIVLVLPKASERGIGSVMRLETAEDRVARVRVYAFCPDAVREVAAALGRPALTRGLYRFDPKLVRLPTRAQPSFE
jgi:RNA polymerase sigma-70 factor (ECF subfamily)